MIVLGVVWIVCIAVTFSVWFGAQMVLKDSEAKYKSSLDQYKALAPEVVTSQILRYRAKIVGGVLATRFEYGSTLEKLSNLFPPEVVLDNFGLDNTRSITLTGKVVGGAGADIIENKVNSINAKEVSGFLSAKLTGLKYRSGEWQFAMEVEIDEKAE